MPGAQLDIARQGIEAYNRGDIDALLALASDDVVFVIPDGLGNAGTYRGREGFVRMIDGWHEAWEDFRIEIEDLVEEGDTVIVGITQHGRGRGSGIEVEMPGAHLMRFRDDRLHFWRLCGSREEALREAGGH